MIYYNFSTVLDLDIANRLDVDNVHDLFYMTSNVGSKWQISGTVVHDPDQDFLKLLQAESEWDTTSEFQTQFLWQGTLRKKKERKKALPTYKIIQRGLENTTITKKERKRNHNTDTINE